MSVLNPQFVIEQGFVHNYDPKNVQGNSIDLRIHTVYRIDGGITLLADGTRELPKYKKVEPFKSPKMIGDEPQEESYFYVFEPEHLYQVEFEEHVRLNEHVCALSVLRSSMYKSGASGESGLYDSGYQGPTGMTIGVKYASTIEVGSPIAQLMFIEATATLLYKGFYQNGMGWVNTDD